MQSAPTASQLLNVWEQARSQMPVQRALSLLALAVPTESVDELARYNIGRRDRELIGLRERIFGPRLNGTAQCPVCTQTISVDFSAADISCGAASDPDQTHVLQSDGYEVRFRLPNSSDLAALDPASEASVRKLALLRQCVARAQVNGIALATDPLPDPIVNALSEHMAELDPQGDIQLSLRCPQCGHSWTSSLDIAAFLWSEIHAWAGHLLRDVHELALTYGWSEADILALSPWRREAYLELIRS